MAVSIYKFVILLILINTAAGIYSYNAIDTATYDATVISTLDGSTKFLAEDQILGDDKKAGNTEIPDITVGSTSGMGRTITAIMSGINPFSIHPSGQTSILGKVLATIVLIFRMMINIITTIKIYNFIKNRDTN